MVDRRDIFEIGGVPVGNADQRAPATQKRPWLSIWFRCCNVYARIYRSADGARYVGRCPRCGAEIAAQVGPDGTNRRCFEAR